MLPDDLLDRYTPVELLGEGGFGRVVAALDQELDRPVAIKLLHASLADDESIGRFRREAEVTAKVRHPHVVALLDSGVLPDGTPYLVYEQIQGHDLETSPPPAGELPEIGAAVAEALAAAHAAGVIHRDVKPANVLRRGPSDPVLADFGIARVDDGGTQYTAEGMILGTPTYMAPELYLGQPPSPASDQFAWAASLVALAGGGSVYGTEEVGGILRVVRRPDSLPVSEAALRILGPLAPVVRQALAPDPARRHADCAAFAKRLRDPPSEAHVQSTVQLSGADVSAASTMAMPAFSSRAETTRKLLIGDGTGRALALRGGVAFALAGLMGWALFPGAGPQPAELPRPEPTVPAPPHPAFADARKRLAEEAAALRALLPARPDGDIRSPTFPEQVEAYPNLTDSRTLLLWNRWLRALEDFLRHAPPAALSEGPAFEELLADGVRLADYFLAYVNEIKFNIQQGSTAFGTLAELKNESGLVRKTHPSWEISAWNELEQALILATEESLCRFDRMLLDEKPAGSLVLCVLVSQLSLVSPSKYLGPADPCQETTRQRFELYLQLIYSEILSREDLTRIRPWLLGMRRLLGRISDSGLFPAEERVLYLADLVAHLELLHEDAPPQLREEAWRILLAEAWRAPYRDPNSPREQALELVERILPWYRRAAADHPEGVEKLLERVRAYPAQNYTSDIPELTARVPELEAMAPRP